MKIIHDDDVLYILQYLTVNLVSRGYCHFKVVQVPEKKRHRTEEIAENICAKYQVRERSLFDLSKYQRARRKQAGLLNGMMIVWRHHLYLLATPGRDDVGFSEKEEPLRFPHRRIPIDTGHDGFRYEIAMQNGKPTVVLAKQSFELQKIFFSEMAKRKEKQHLIKEFQRLDRLAPSYAGVFIQKRSIRTLALRTRKRSGYGDIAPSELVINPRRPKVRPKEV